MILFFKNVFFINNHKIEKKLQFLLRQYDLEMEIVQNMIYK